MVMIEYLYVLKLLAALGCGLIAGVFFAFSTFVMKALAQQQSAQGIAAMQSINITVINPWFMAAFLGTGVVCLVLMVSSLLRWQQPGTVYLLVGALFYLMGCFGVTMVFNVPLNDALAVANPDSPEGADLWARYLTDWTFWNHVRTIAAFIAAALFTMATNAPPNL
ncbi:anthrone oxygenase family protein [Egbenema bharatensis]|uniref:anthrone oxygenase family protein n=1 Tax=Egbenema bharatensis TaxID=3463334 RepID=UPI003A86A83F